jgi:hypothetical protein
MHGRAAAHPAYQDDVALVKLIAVNAEFGLLLCARPQCHKAVSPANAVEHLRKTHKE